MELPKNCLKRALRSGEPLIGFWAALCSNIAIEAVGGAGFDWIVIDTEHTPNDLASVLVQLHALQGSSAAPIVRLPSADPAHVKRMLDIGAMSFLVPMVESGEQATAIVAATRYPPRGNRGVYLANRGRRFGRVADYFEKADEEVCLICQIETVKGLKNLEDIAAVDGIDAIFIGASDLSADMGYIGSPGHPDVEAAVLEAIQRLKKADCPGGTLEAGRLGVAQLVEAGFAFISVGSDLGVLVSQTDALARTKRAEHSGRSVASSGET